MRAGGGQLGGGNAATQVGFEEAGFGEAVAWRAEAGPMGGWFLAARAVVTLLSELEAR